jgi:serine/threonine protein kinase
MQPDIIAGRYRIVRPVGRGGMGTVWLCVDETLHREVALKQIGSLPGETPGDAARAMREARVTAALNHPNAISLYDVVEHDATTWLVMEYMASRTLSQLIASEGWLAPERVAAIAAQVAAALSSAHAMGIIHRDIKPGNILVGPGDEAKISDFGIARGHADVRHTQTGMVIGTPTFFSPELARGEESSFASDVWALGITLYTATEGAPPYQPQTNPLAMLSLIANEPVPPPKHAGPLRPVLAGMLDPDPSQRVSMAEALASLNRVREDSAAAAALADGPAKEQTTTRALTLESPVEPDYEQPIVIPAYSARWVDNPAAHGGFVDSPAATGELIEARAAPRAQPARQHSRVGRLIAVVLGVLVLAGAGALLANLLGSPSPSSPSTSPGAAGTVTHSQSGHRHQAGTSSSSGSGGSTTGTATTAVPPTINTSTTLSTTSAPDTTSTSPTSTSAPAGGLSASSPEAFTRLYYRTVPGNLDGGWSMLAPSMQATVGRASYDNFWHTIAAVKVSSVHAIDSSTVRYRITYTFVSGGTSVENKQLTLTRSGDTYLITSDTEAQ